MKKSDALKSLKSKMEEYISCGCALAWLIDLANESIYIYQSDGSKTHLKGFDQIISNQNILPFFKFDLSLML